VVATASANRPALDFDRIQVVAAIRRVAAAQEREERLRRDWRETIRRDKRGGIRVSGADDSVLRLAPSDGSHVKLQIHDSEEYLAGIVLCRGRVEWLRERLAEWLESGRVQDEES
jgi:hypothetical protein